MVKLGDVCKIIGGYAFKSEEFITDGVPVIRISNLDGETVNVDKNVCYSVEFLKNNNNFTVRKNDILMAMSGATVGKIGVYQNEDVALLNQRVCNLKPIEDKLNREYLNCYCQSDYFKSEILKNAFGCAQPNISVKQIADFEIKILDLKSQVRIANKLKKILCLIEKRKQQLQKLDELVKARFVEMFGNPVRNEMCWEQSPLSSCLESIDNGKSFVCDNVARKGDWPAVLKLNAVTYGFYRPEENKAMLDESQFVVSAEVHTGDLLFTRKNTPELVGMCAYVYETPSGLMMPDLIFRLNTTERCNKVFLWKLINHNLFRECIQAIATGSAKSMSNISKERLLNLEIILPPIEQQNQFADFVQQIDKSKLYVQKSLEKMEMLKKALMQKYFG